ncbi:MAG: DUF1800 family protein [Xanthomonadales bacterium]|nr:DUF1800 family protein [Xanthomonadales bacterium]
MLATNLKSLMLGLGAVVMLDVAYAQSHFDPDRQPFPIPLQNNQIVTLSGLTTLPQEQWNAVAVRKVLQSFAFGGHASEQQIKAWSEMPPELAITQMLNFEWLSPEFSAPDGDDESPEFCQSMTELQALWGSDDPANPMRAAERRFYALLGPNDQLSPVGLYLAWSRAMYTRGCNLFLHKMAFYLTNYHASIHIQNAGTGLIRDYYDDTLSALNAGEDFIGLMLQAASNGAVAMAYGHASNYVHPITGMFSGNDDFAREYFQLLFGIEGATEDLDYHEGVSIENNAKLLTGMAPDLVLNRFDSIARFDWLLSNIDFTDHVDSTGRRVRNRTAHYDFALGPSSCLEILHQSICGSTAAEKLQALGRVAAAHPESMAAIPLKLVRFFADTVITPDEAMALQLAWDDADFDLLRFIRAYAVSSQFHDPSRWKYWSAFERNLIVHNATLLDNEEAFAKPIFTDPLLRMSAQGAIPFAPIRDVFGGQTGNDAANDRFVFKNAWAANVETPETLAAVSQILQRDGSGNPPRWSKDWRSVLPANQQGEYRVKEVAEWLWNRLITDGGQEFDMLARAQVYSLLATGFDFTLVLEFNDQALQGQEGIFTSADLQPGTIANQFYEVLAGMQLDLADPRQQHQLGMAINFISMLPFAFASGGAQP